jgi:trehalose-6-phosphatase
MSKVNGLFLDYDGTLSPLDVSRQHSRIPPHLEALLNVMRQAVPIGILTTKDLPFIVPRTLFAYAWCAIAGMEMKVGSQLFVAQGVEQNLPPLIEALIYAKQNVSPGGVIEEKCDYRGLPLAFCVDWRQMKDEREAKAMYAPILAYCKSLPVEVIEYPGRPYFDVYYCSIDKGKTLNRMKEKMGLLKGILYMGDSMTDNAAFKAADISIGVTEGKKPDDLDCQYWIEFDDVASFLSCLYKNQFTFSADLPGINVME